MWSIHVLDWYSNRNYVVDAIPDDIVSQLIHKQKIVYRVPEKQGYVLSVGECLKHTVDTKQKVSFEKILDGEDLIYFDQMHTYAQELYPDFRKTFRKSFPGSIPVAARFHIYTDQVYFYFYAQERYNFAEYARDLRHKIAKNIFLYQVSPRDMIRISPAFEHIIWYNGISLCEKSTRDLPEITMDDIILQNLEWRDIERLKSWNGKFKPSLWYELDLYRQESLKYPAKWSHVINTKEDIQGVVLSYNIMNGNVKIKTKDGDIFFIPYEDLSLRSHS
jgi:AraC-like DNA-binding protein